MAGNLEDPSKWRLRTITGIPYKEMSMDGSLGVESAQVSVSVLIEAKNLLDFATFLMPPPIRIGNLEFPITRSLDGIPQIVVKSLRFKSFDDSLPIDPFGSDEIAPSKTYFKVIQIDINFATGKNQTKDPFTFLEITGNATGQFFHTPAPKSKWQCDTGGSTIDPETNEVVEDRVTGIAEVNRDPLPPVTITVPTTEWTISWPQIRFDLFRDVIIHRLRILMGKVNSTKFPLLFNASPETLLFEGYSYRQTNTWRFGEINTPPISVEIKITEKRVLWKGLIRGHNEFWRPEEGWCRLLVNGTDNVYESRDFNNLFRS